MLRKIIGLVLLLFVITFTILHAPQKEQGEEEYFEKVPQIVSLVAVGDISYSRGVERMVFKAKDINYPLLRISDYLNGADLVFGNLETPITPGTEIPAFNMLFRSNPGTEQALKKAGFSILSLANNHTPNFGDKGLQDTFNYLDLAGIKYVGAGKNEQEANRPVYLEKDGVRFAFLAYNDPDVVPASYEASENNSGTAFMRIDKMTEAVKEAKLKADFVIVSMHSGTEYVERPNDSQINFAHAAIEAGADLILGHHPHVIQTLEKYRGKFIFYSLGNFIFDQPQSLETRESLIVKVYFSKDKIEKIQLQPVFMEKIAQPRIANIDEAEKILKRLDFPLELRRVYFWDSDKNSYEKTYQAELSLANSQNDNPTYKREEKDLNNDSTDENYVLKNGNLTISQNLKVIWQSPNDWQIDDFILADSNNDGITDINLSLWKAGNFGSSQPFWVKENDQSIKNHFFVLNLVKNSVKTIWGSSNLTAPNCEFKIADVDNDGLNDLIVIEGDYEQAGKCVGNYLAIWKWNDWGFSNDWRSEKGDFSNLEKEIIL